MKLAEIKDDYKVQLSKKERKELEKLFRNSSNPKIKDRIRCILLRDKGYTLEQLEEILICSHTHVRDIIKLYKSDGIKGLITLNYTGDPGNLTVAEKRELKEYVKKTDHLQLNKYLSG